MSVPESASGSCLCGAVRFTASLPSLLCAHRHGWMCRCNHLPRLGGKTGFEPLPETKPEEGG